MPVDNSANEPDFDPQAYDYVEAHALSITDAAIYLGVAPAAVAGAITEERNSFVTGSPVYQLLDMGLDRLSLMSSHESIATGVSTYDGDHGWSAKALHVAARDLGAGNIKVATAVDLLDNYLDEHPSDDPLNLKQYDGHYDKMVADIIDPNSSATGTFAALAIKEAQDFFCSAS